MDLPRLFPYLFLEKGSFSRWLISEYTNIGQIGLPILSGSYALYRRDFNGVGLLMIALSLNQICIETLKRVIPVKRPTGHAFSFPSGHTAAAFLAVAFLRNRYGVSILTPALTAGYLAATFVGIGRILVKAHWLSDVFVGAYLGHLVSYLIVPKFE